MSYNRAITPHRTPGARAGRILELPPLTRWAAAALGFCLQFNVLTETLGLPFLRLSDALIIAVSGVFITQVSASVFQRAFLFTASSAALIAASVLFKTYPGNGDTYFSLVLLASAAMGFLFVEVQTRSSSLSTWFSVGWLLGFAASTVVIVIRVWGIDLTSIGLGVPLQNTSILVKGLAAVKPGGLWTHGNEAGHVFALAGAPALYLALKRQKPSIYGLYYCFFLLTFTITLNRGGIIAPTLGLLFAYTKINQTRSLVRLLAMIVFSVVLVAALSFAPIFEGLRSAFIARFSADSRFDGNIADRLRTLAGGVQVALHHPFGIGFVERGRELAYMTRIHTPHNGIISLAYQAGLAVAGLYVWSLIHVVFFERGALSLVRLLVIFSVPSMFFEELTINSVFLFVIALTLAAPWASRQVPRRTTDTERHRILRQQGSAHSVPPAEGI